MYYVRSSDLTVVSLDFSNMAAAIFGRVIIPVLIQKK